jgi:hypothetical protein
MSDLTCQPRFDEIEVGPVDTLSGAAYKYKACGYLSTNTYANAASALYAARKPQRFTLTQTLDPGTKPTVEPVPGL